MPIHSYSNSTFQTPKGIKIIAYRAGMKGWKNPPPIFTEGMYHINTVDNFDFNIA